MKTDRKVVEYRREADGTYQRVELESSRPCPCESSESKKIRSLAACGITVCRIKDRSPVFVRSVYELFGVFHRNIKRYAPKLTGTLNSL